MLIELHSHHMTPKMFDVDDPRAPRWKIELLNLGGRVDFGQKLVAQA